MDVAIVGAGAAGLATAIFSARRLPHRRIVAIDGAAKIGAKILVSGGGRCNVTNAHVAATDFQGGAAHVVRRVLSAFSERDTRAWFEELGVALHEEEHGKLFPDSNDAQTVLDALLAEASRRNVEIITARRVTDVSPAPEGFRIITEPRPSPENTTRLDPTAAQHDSPASATLLTARCVVLATGGRSLPKTGSDGQGYTLACRFGHSITEPSPALVPLILDGDFHQPLSGIAQEVEVTARIEGQKPHRIRGAMLWTHFGASGPAILDVSRHWHRATLDGQPVQMHISFAPGLDFNAVDQRLLDAVARQPTTQLHNALSSWLPSRVADAMLRRLNVDGRVVMAHLSKDARRKLVHALTAWPLPVRDSRGYNFAEVTAGGVPLDEIDPATMSSRKHPGLFLVGEILDVDGRIGGFNFQWSWSSAWTAADGIARLLHAEDRDGT